MVTIQEIQQREQELSTAEAQNRAVSKEKIPQRRFGAGVTKQQQQAVIERRKEAQENLKKIQEQRQELQRARGQIQSLESQRAESERIQGEIDFARKLAASGRKSPPPGVSKRVKELFRKFREEEFQPGEARADFQKAATEQGFKPVIENGRVVGFIDTRTGTAIFGGRPEDIARATPEQVERLKEGGIVKDSGEVKVSEIESEERLNELDRFNIVQRAKLSSTFTSSEQKRAVSVRETPLSVSKAEKSTGFFEENLEKVSKTRALRQTQVLRGQTPGLKTEIAYLSGSFLTPVFRTGLFVKQALFSPKDTAINVAQAVKVTTTKVFTTGFPEIGKRIREEPAGSFAQVLGEVTTAKALGQTGRLTTEFTKTSIKGFKPIRTRVSDVIPNLEEKFIKNLDIGGIGEIRAIPERTQRKLPTLLPSLRGAFGYTKKEQLVFKGQPGPAVTSQADFQAFNKPLPKEFFVTPPLEDIGFFRISRLGLQKDASLFEFLTEDITLKRQKPRIITFEDTTPFKFTTLETSELEATLPPGKTIVPERTVGATLIRGKSVEIVRARVANVEDLTSKEISKAVKFQKELSKPISSKPIAPSIRLTTTTLSRSFKSGRLPTTSIVSISKTVSGTPTAPSTSSLSTILRTGVPSAPVKLPPSTPLRPRGRSASTPVRPITRTPPPRTPSPPILSPRIPSTTKTTIFPFKKQQRLPKGYGNIGFKTFIIRRGEKQYLPGIAPRGRALEKGATRVKGSLAATFGVEATRVRVKQKDIAFAPSQKVFREYKIKKGRKIQLKDVFIQRTTQEGGLRGGRLAFGTEIKAIQQSKMMRLPKIRI